MSLIVNPAPGGGTGGDPEPPTDVERLRLLAGENRTGSTYSDDQLAAILAGHVCQTPQRDPVTKLLIVDSFGEPVTTETPDVYGAAAAVWEEKAYTLAGVQASAGGASGAVIASERNADTAVSYDTTKAGPATVNGMLALAARLRRKSCNAAASTVHLAGPGTFRRGDGGIGEMDVQLTPRPLSIDDPSVLNRPSRYQDS